VLRRTVRFALALAACAATTSIATAAHADPVTELLGGNGPVIPLKDAAMVVKTDVGYRYQAGQQNSHLVVTQVGNRLHFADTGTARLKKFPASCRKEPARRGIALSCKVPAQYSTSKPMFLEIWPRLGHDFVDGSTLSATFRMWVLADAGRDRVFTGAGDDFVNGAQDADKVRGGAGDDWLRMGDSNDKVWGGNGDDKLLGLDGADKIQGGAGADQVLGGNGNDRLSGGPGNDKVNGGSGADDAWFDSSDRVVLCEWTKRA
jgi:serralysin